MEVIICQIIAFVFIGIIAREIIKLIIEKSKSIAENSLSDLENRIIAKNPTLNSNARDLHIKQLEKRYGDGLNTEHYIEVGINIFDWNAMKHQGILNQQQEKALEELLNLQKPLNEAFNEKNYCSFDGQNKILNKFWDHLGNMYEIMPKTPKHSFTAKEM
jgi:hypothetical protein